MDVEFNAFSQGVSPGGLRNTTQIKILIEYLISTLTGKVTKQTILQALTTSSLVNYFEVLQCTYELIENGSILVDEEGQLSLSDMGKMTLRELVDSLPLTVRERAVADGAAYQLTERIHSAMSANIEADGDKFKVILKVYNNGETLMCITLQAADVEQAEQMKSAFLDDPAKLYSTVISLLS